MEAFGKGDKLSSNLSDHRVELDANDQQKNYADITSSGVLLSPPRPQGKEAAALLVVVVAEEEEEYSYNNNVVPATQ